MRQGERAFDIAGDGFCGGGSRYRQQATQPHDCVRRRVHFLCGILKNYLHWSLSCPLPPFCFEVMDVDVFAFGDILNNASNVFSIFDDGVID